jgi:hypothetical protein
MKLNINDQPIAVRVVSFSADLDKLCLDREQLILDIFVEVNKRKRPEANHVQTQPTRTPQPQNLAQRHSPVQSHSG